MSQCDCRIERGSVLPFRLNSKSILQLIVLFLVSLLSVNAETQSAKDDASQLLPSAIGDFRANGPPRKNDKDVFGATVPDGEFATVSSFARGYSLRGNGTVTVSAARMATEAAAYAQLKRFVDDLRAKGDAPTRVSSIGTLAYATKEQVAFFKGPVFVTATADRAGDAAKVLADLAGQYSQTLASSDNDIPPLVKHLPDWIQVEERARYAVSLSALKGIAGNQPVLDAIDFGGGTEAVLAPYDNSQLAIVEFTTPQLATTNDARIQARLAELRNSGQPVPTAYRRVGNYAVFVFNAPDAKTAESLIGGVSYEQVVQWLGNNPNILRRAQKAYAATTAGIVLAVMKASGISLIACLAIGGLFGAYVFRRRRKKMVKFDTYSDAGGMTRLNIDELNVQTDTRRLISGSRGGTS